LDDVAFFVKRVDPPGVQGIGLSPLSCRTWHRTLRRPLNRLLSRGLCHRFRLKSRIRLPYHVVMPRSIWPALRRGIELIQPLTVSERRRAPCVNPLASSCAMAVIPASWPRACRTFSQPGEWLYVGMRRGESDFQVPVSRLFLACNFLLHRRPPILGRRRRADERDGRRLMWEAGRRLSLTPLGV